jgi:hypothetical protein
LSENCRKTPSRKNRKRWKIPLISKYSVRIIKTRQINCRKIPLISKYSVIIVGTRRINLIYMLEKISVPLTSESVTSGQADGVFRQLFLQCSMFNDAGVSLGMFLCNFINLLSLFQSFVLTVQ